MNTVVLNQRFSWATFRDIVLTNENHAWRSSPHSFCITVLERNSPSQLVIQNSRAWRSTCPFSLQIHQEVHHLFSWLQKNSYQQHWDQKLSGRIGCKLFFFSPKTLVLSREMTPTTGMRECAFQYVFGDFIRLHFNPPWIILKCAVMETFSGSCYRSLPLSTQPREKSTNHRKRTNMAIAGSWKIIHFLIRDTSSNGWNCPLLS